MFRLFLAMIVTGLVFAAAPPQVEAGHRGYFVPRRTVNTYRRDVRQFQRQTTRSFSQFNRTATRNFRSIPQRSFAPRSNAVFLGGSRGGLYFRF